MSHKTADGISSCGHDEKQSLSISGTNLGVENTSKDIYKYYLQPHGLAVWPGRPDTYLISFCQYDYQSCSNECCLFA